MASTTEHERLQEARERHVPWRKWGPYVSERQWGTVREDYSDNGAGLGANHQTGWTGLVGMVIRLFGALDPKRMLEVGKMAAFNRRPAKT